MESMVAERSKLYGTRCAPTPADMAPRWLLALPVLIAVSAGLGALSGSFEQPLPPALNGVNAPRAPKSPAAPSSPPAQTAPHGGAHDEPIPA